MARLAAAALLVCGGGSGIAHAQAQGGPPVPDMVPTLTENFDGTTLNTTRWRTSLGSAPVEKTTISDRSLYGNRERQVYFDKAFLGLGIDPFRVANGKLTITARPLSTAAKAALMVDLAKRPASLQSSALKDVKYSSGVITTRNSFSQRYGYFEIRARWSGGKGLWPAFWMLPQTGAWPPEIDILEAHGDKPTTAYHSLHSKIHAAKTIASKLASPTSAFHRYGVLWSANKLDFYIDGVLKASIPTAADTNSTPMYLLANLAVGGYWPGDPDAKTVFPATMDIDYIRAWQFRGVS